MADQTYKREDIVLVDTEINETFSAPAKLPVNLDQFNGLRARGIARGVVSTVSLALWNTPAFLVLVGMAGSNADGSIDQSLNAAYTTRDALKGLSFKEYPNNPIRIKLMTKVVVLKQLDGTLDIVLTHQPTYSTAYNFLPPYDGDGGVQASLYRDRVLFAVKPQAPSAMKLGKVSPINEIKEIFYSFQTSWSIGGGITGNIGVESGDKQPKGAASVGFNANGSYSFSSSTSLSKRDFNLVKTAGEGSKDEVVSWAAELQRVYENRGNQPFDYDWKNPSLIVRSSGLTNWISAPPESATNDLDPSFITCFQIPASAVTSDLIRIDIAAMQQLPHAVSLGRWGAPRARMGGQPFILNNSFEASGTLVIDLNTKTARLENKIGRFKTAFDKAQETVSEGEKMQREAMMKK